MYKIRKDECNMKKLRKKSTNVSDMVYLYQAESKSNTIGNCGDKTNSSTGNCGGKTNSAMTCGVKTNGAPMRC